MKSHESLDLIWGIDKIAHYIGRTPRQCYEALSKGEIPARQINGRWVASATSLRKHFEGHTSEGPAYD